MNEASANEKKFVECIQDSYLTQHILLPTRGDNILDLVMSDNERFVEDLIVGETFGTSNNCFIKWDMIIIKIRNNKCNNNLLIF